VENELFTLFGKAVTVGTALIPVFAGVIGLFTNWVAIKMMFLPINWVGVKMPFKILGFPVFGWQGIIPSKAAKMGSIAVDTGLAKLGSMSEFYKEFEPEVLSAHIVAASRDEVHATVDQILQREYAELWKAAPAPVKALVHAQVEAQLPAIVAKVMTGIGENIDHLVDLKLMVIRHMEKDPRLINRVFQEVGAKEFRFIINSGGWMGFLLGLGPMAAWLYVPEWWTVPIGAAIVGYATNWIALKVIFQPIEPVKIGPFTLHGLFLRRQDEVAQEYSHLIAHDIVTLPNIATTMIHGPEGDRTRRLIADTLDPVVDDAVGLARPLVQAATLGRYESLKDQLAATAADSTIGTLDDTEFAVGRAEALKALLAERMRELSYRDFAQMLRSAFEEDEWMLIVVGAALGFGAGVVQLALTL